MPHAKELKSCPCCGSGLGLTPVEITVQRMFTDTKAVNEYMGMNQFSQGHMDITDVMVPDTELVKKISESELVRILVCMDCYLTNFGRLNDIESKENE